jgi:hypothetical protein
VPYLFEPVLKCIDPLPEIRDMQEHLVIHVVLPHYDQKKGSGSDKEPERNPGDEEHEGRVFQAANKPPFTHLPCNETGEKPLEHCRMGEEPLIEEEINDPAEALGTGCGSRGTGCCHRGQE